MSLTILTHFNLVNLVSCASKLLTYKVVASVNSKVPGNVFFCVFYAKSVFFGKTRNQGCNNLVVNNKNRTSDERFSGDFVLNYIDNLLIQGWPFDITNVRLTQHYATLLYNY